MSLKFPKQQVNGSSPFGVTELDGAVHKERSANRKKVRAGRVDLKREMAAKYDRCEACGWVCPRLLLEPETLLHMHHVIPVQCGGGNAPENLVMICPNCHAMAHRMFGVRAGRYVGPAQKTELIAQLRRYLSDPGGHRIMRELAEAVSLGDGSEPVQENLFAPDVVVVPQLKVAPERRGRKSGAEFREYRMRK